MPAPVGSARPERDPLSMGRSAARRAAAHALRAPVHLHPMALLDLPAARAAAEAALAEVFGCPVVLAAPHGGRPASLAGAAGRAGGFLLRMSARAGRGLGHWLTEEVADPAAVGHIDRLARGPRWPWALMATAWLLLVALSWIGLSSLYPAPTLPWASLVTAGNAAAVARAFREQPSAAERTRYAYYWTHYADFAAVQCVYLTGAARATCAAAAAVQRRFPPSATLRAPETLGQRLAFLYEYRHGTRFSERQCALLPSAYVEDCVHGGAAAAVPGG